MLHAAAQTYHSCRLLKNTSLRPFGEDFAFLFLSQSFIIALCLGIVSGTLYGYRVFGTALIIIPIFSKSVFAYRKVAPLGLTLAYLHSILLAFDAF